MILNGKGSRAFCLFTELSRGYGQHSVEYIKKYAANTEFIDFLFMGAGDNFPDVRRSRNPRPKRRGKGVRPWQTTPFPLEQSEPGAAGPPMGRRVGEPCEPLLAASMGGRAAWPTVRNLADKLPRTADPGRKRNL